MFLTNKLMRSRGDEDSREILIFQIQRNSCLSFDFIAGDLWTVDMELRKNINRFDEKLFDVE